MANPFMGETEIELDGKKYTLYAGINALAEVEALFSTANKRVTVQEVMRLATEQSMTHIRGLVWAMLRKHHKDMTLEAVGDLIDRVGIGSIDQAFAQSMAQMAPDPDDLKDLGIDRPLGAQSEPETKKAGTGARSTRKRVN